MQVKPNILSIAGSDPLSKSGIMADFKVGIDLSANIFNVITAINAQNNQKIVNICYLESKIIQDQLKVIFEQNKITMVKIGMVGDLQSIDIIINFLKDKNIKIIFDPVLKASNGYDLIPANAIDNLKQKLLPICHLLTPNINELEILSKIKINNLADIKKAVKILQNYGAQNILVKGGHFQEKSDKVNSFLFLEDQVTKIQNKRLDKKCRGTGCMLSTAIAIFLGADYNLIEAVKKANKYVYHKIKSE
ncbi:hydroxymethylpyrimidine/phosphomethylpyrimidine kinase [Rickettsiales bacterium]|nr:hydroxymethylpyrimidine/phosphomethylpyrimidine kinase [Rickettsiales bacterium]MDB2550248.1 hydroxymethylpyrimidine/phosphomethylpyrimidine kinase [Rickettsiales bacterium]